MSLDTNNPAVVHKADSVGFKSVRGDSVSYPLPQTLEAGGKYYFEIKVIKGKLLKIGVCRPGADMSKAFSDTELGWAMFNGEVRHGADYGAEKYGQAKGGSRLKDGDVVGVLVDMREGTLAYTRNGVYLGLAFRDPELKRGSLFPAVASVYK
jgi:hypothetical protein